MIFQNLAIDAGEAMIQLNPLNPNGATGKQLRPHAQADLSNPGAIISRFFDFAFPIAGVILLLMLLWGGFEMITGATNKKSLDSGRQRITAAVIGFIVLFSSLWLMRIIETIFGISIIELV